MSKTQFINAVKNGAISGWHKHKILPSISIAQAILESGWGGSDLSKAPNYNLFGIKASDDWAGEVVNMPTQEWSQSKGYYWIRANFRKYNSWDESIEDHGSFFTNTPWRKQNYARVIGEKDYKVAAKMLRECGYATDVEYPNKLIRIIDQYNLTQYDRIAFEGGITNTSTPPTNTMSPDYYLRKTVGDSLSSGSEATAKHIDVTFIGDSLLVGTEPKLKRFKWKKANYNAKGSRQWTHTDVELNAIEQLKTMLANGQVHNYVVFVLGTNRGVTADEIKQAVDLCGAGRKILLVDTLSEVAHREAVAQAYKQASEQYSNVFYGDWSRYSKLRIDDNYYKDGPNGERIHMTPIGYERHANFIMHALYQMYNYGNTSGTPNNMSSVADIEYDDGIFTSPIGETIIYNKKLNDQFSFKSKKGNVLWIEKVLQTDKEDPQEAMAEGVAYMKEHAHPAVHYTVKLNELPDTVSIGDTGIFIDHEFNPPLAIEARILNITTSETNKNANTVTIGNVKELFPQSKEDILALQQQLQATREELLTQAYLDDVYEIKIESSNGLALAGGAEGFGKDLIEKVEGNTFYLRKPKSLSNGFKIKGKIDDKHLINRHDGLVADSLTNPIDFNPDYENPQGSDTAYPLKPFDSHELEVSEFTATFYDESGGLINGYKVPIYLDGNFNLPVKFERVPHTMKITSDMDITFDYILVFEEYLSVEEDETTELTARVFKNGVEITDEIDHFTWTKVSSDGREDEGWKDLNKFNQTNKITIKASDLKDFESRFNVKAFDKQIEELIASNGVTIKNQISPAIAAAKAEAERMDAEIKKEIDTVLDRFDTERTETEQAINEALESAKAEAERLDEERQTLIDGQISDVISKADTDKLELSNAIDTALTDAIAEAERLDSERQLIIDGKFEVVNQAQTTLEGSIATAEQNAQSALTKAGASEDLASTAKQASDNALAQFQTTSTELAEAKATAEKTLQNAINALSGANSVITQSQTLLDNAESAKTEATNALLEAQRQLEASGVISGNLTTFKNEVNNTIKGYVTKATYDSNNQTLNTRMTEWEKTTDGITTSISEIEGKVDNLEIGGRNIIRGTSYAKSSSLTSAIWNDLTVPLEVGEYNFQFIAKASENTPAKVYFNDDTGQKRIGVAEYIPINLTTDYQKFTGVIDVITADGSNDNHIVFRIYQNSSVTIEIKENSLKVEKGNVTTGWSPAPEDLVSQSEYSVYKNETEETVKGFTRTVSAYKQDVTGYKNQVATFSQTVDGYKSEVAKQTETLGGLTTEVATYKQAVDGYSSELSKNTTATNGYKTEVAGYKQTVDGYGSKLTEYTKSNATLTAKVNDYEATVDGYSQSLTRVEGKVDNLEIGGTNLIKNSQDLSSQMDAYSGVTSTVVPIDMTDEWGFSQAYDVLLHGGTSTIKGVWTSSDRVTAPMTLGQQYTHSFWIKNLSSGNSLQIATNGLEPNKNITLAPGESIRYQHTGVRRQDYNWYQILFRSMVAGSNIRFAVGRFKLEKGNKATDWTPAPEDLVSQSEYAVYQNQVKSTTDEHTRRLTALDGTGGRVSKVEQTATQIQTSLSDYAKTTYVDTAVTTKAGEINTNLTNLESRVDSSLPTNLIITTGAIPNSYILDTDTYPTPTTGQSGSETMKDLIPVLPSKRYYFSKGKGTGTDNYLRIMWLDASKNNITRQTAWDDDTLLSFVSPSNAKYCWVSYPIGGKPMMTYEVPHTRYYESPIDAVTRLEFQTVKETTKLYERTIGTTETDIKSKIAKITMTDSLFQTEIGKYSEKPRNLFYDPTNLSKFNKLGIYDVVKVRTTVGAMLRVTVTDAPSTTDTYAGVELPLSVNSLSKGDYSFRIGAWVETIPERGFSIKIFDKRESGSSWYFKTHKPTTTGYQTFTGNFTLPQNFSNFDPMCFQVYLRGNGQIVIGHGVLVNSSVVPTEIYDSGDNFLTSQVTQLSNSWALTLKSGDDIKTAINATTDGIRLKGNLITLDGQVNMTSSFIVPEGNIGNLSAKKITSGTIDSARIDAKTIVTNGLQANVIKSTHILADEALFTKLFTDDLATQKLATKQAWITNANISSLDASKITSGTIDTARLNAKHIVTSGLEADVVVAKYIKADEALFTKLFTDDLATQKLATKQAWIKSSMIGEAQIGTAQIGTIDAGTGKIVNIDAQYITANHAQLVSAGFQSLNSNLSINGGAIRIQNSDGDFATMNAIPEVRSQDSAGTAAILGKGRSQYYSNNQSRFYIGSSLNGDEYNGSVVHGVHISIGQTWGIYRKSDSFGGTPAQYHIVKSGESWRSITDKYFGVNASVSTLMQLNGYNVNNYPVLQPGDTILIKKEVPGNSSGIERIWTMGTSSNGTPRTYSHVHHVFEGGTTGVSDARLKHDIKPTDIKALEHISKLAFKQFKWNRNDELEPLGLIAQESGILRVPDEEMEGIDIQRAMMLALKGIQELSQKVQELEEQNETLRTNNRGTSN